MKRNPALALALLLAAAGLAAARLQEPPSLPKPGPEHELLRKFEGTWTFQAKFQTEPGKETTSAGTQTNTLDLGGLWLIQDIREDQGPFRGHGMVGYDPQKKKYVSAWVDTMISHIELAEGTADKEGKGLTMESTGPGPEGKPVKTQQIYELAADGTIKLTIQATTADGKTTTMGTIEYKRK